MRHQKTKTKKSKKPRKSNYRIEHNSYDPKNPLTSYVERVCGINVTKKFR